MADAKYYASSDRLEIREVTIANGGHTSDAEDISGLRVAAIRMPAAWTAADIAFSESPDDALDYLPLYDDGGTEYTAAVSTSRAVRLDEGLLDPVAFLKLRSVTAGGGGATVNQGADRVIALLCVPL